MSRLSFVLAAISLALGALDLATGEQRGAIYQLVQALVMVALGLVALRRRRVQQRGQERHIVLSEKGARRATWKLAVLVAVPGLVVIVSATRSEGPNKYVGLILGLVMFACGPATLLLVRRLKDPDVQERMRIYNETGEFPPKRS